MSNKNITNIEDIEDIKDIKEINRINMINNQEKLPLTRRNYKDTVFRMVFSKPEDLLSLYNAVNGTDYTNVADLEINTLENAIYMSMKNDISFIFDFELNIYEHQSTKNCNIPLRNLFYVSHLLEKTVKGEALYSSRPVSIPTPKFVVFYNGIDNGVSEVSEYRLSSLYQKQEVEPELELVVKVLNINAEMNYTIKEHCKKLKDYCTYVEKIREYKRDMSTGKAVENAIDYCIANDILKDFLRDQRAEVTYMSIFEFNEEEMEKYRRAEKEVARAEGLEEGREEGRAEGRAEGREEGIQEGFRQSHELVIKNLIQMEFSVEKISDIVGMTPDEIKEYIDLIPMGK